VPAEYGRTAGGLFNFSLKSGTNQFRGSAYGFLRNEALNANTWQNNYNLATDPDNADDYQRAKDRQYVIGGSLGGPIIKDKTFFFLAVEEYQQSRFLLGGLNSTVPTERMLGGDFGELLRTDQAPLGTDAAGNPIYPGAILDPQTGVVFPGNVIPGDRISNASQQIVDIYRQGYLPQADRVSENMALPFYNDPDFKQHQVSLKMNHRFSNASVLTGSFIWTQRPRTLVDQGGIWDPNDELGGPLSKGRRQDVGSRQFRVSHSWTASPNVINVANFTYSSYNNPSEAVGALRDTNWISQLGFGDTGVNNFPEIGFGDAVNGVETTAIGYGLNNGYKGQVFIVSDSLSWVTGKHMFKFGGEFRYMDNRGWTSTGVQDYNFSPATTGVTGQPWSNQVGFGFASFLLGEVASANQETDGEMWGRRNYFALYAQDDWRVSDNLTLNLGLRWESTGAWTEKNGNWATFDNDAMNPVTTVPGALVFAQDGNTTFEGPRDWSQLGPRVGLTYTPTPKLVVRAAYGMFYQPIGMDYWFGVPYSFAPGYRSRNAVDALGQGIPVFNWDGGYPGQEVPGTEDPNFTQWGMVSMSKEGLKAGRIQQWNAGFEYELTNDLVLGANYIGTRGSRLNSGDFQRNQPDMDALGSLVQRGQEWNWVYDEASAAAAGVPYPYPGYSGSAFHTLAPFPQISQTWGPQLWVGSPLGSSDYTAFQFTLVKRMSSGLAANVSYTWAKSHGNQESGFQERWWAGPLQDVNDLDFEADVIGFNDRTHVFKGYVAYELPFGQGRKWMDQGGVLDAIFGGWQVSVIFKYMSGLPLGITSNNWYAGWFYPIYVNADPNGNYDTLFGGNFDASNPTAAGNQYFNGNNYSNPAYGQFGTGPGRFEQQRGFGWSGEDLGFLKNFTFGDRYRLQVRFDLINVFNRHYYSNPVTDIGSNQFGYVVSTTGQPRQGQIGIRFEF
jgi:outer membrane receptor protein involved in Fe transport